MRWLSTLALISALILAGCATKKEIADQAEKGSLATEETNNRLLLLNIVRAYYRTPMHFVRFNALRAPMGIGSPNFSLPLPFGSAATNAYTLTTSIKPDQPGFDLQLLDTQEFYRGMTTQIKPELMQYFLEQGWPQQMILFLFVREIETIDLAGKRTSYVNYPAGDSAFPDFVKLIESLRNCELVMHEDVQATLYGPPLDISAATSPEKLAAMKTAGVDLKELKNGSAVRYQVQQIRRTPQLRLTPLGGGDMGSCRMNGDAAVFSSDGKASNDGPKTVFTLRSVEAMIYYIGELARRQLDGTLRGHEPGIHCLAYGGMRNEKGVTEKARTRSQEAAKQCEKLERPFETRLDPLFVLDRDAGGDAAVRVAYNGTQFSIPKGPRAGRSMHVMSLLTQLVALQNKGADLPTTQSVRVVNPQ